MQLGRFIILDFGVNVHSHLAVFVSGKILYGFRINRSINQVRDISVTQLMRCHLKIHRIYQLRIVRLMLTKLRLYHMLNLLQDAGT